MSSRLTGPVSKFTRSISTTPAIARPTHLLNHGSNAAVSRKGSAAAAAAANLAEQRDDTRAHSTATLHRPTLAPRTIPLMQGFRTSAPKPSPTSASSIDRAILPDLSEPSRDLYAYIRVPLLPDNASPPAGTRLPEAEDLPLARPEISVVAANPETVLPAALTEVEGMGADGVELKFAEELHRGKEEEREMGEGMLKNIWKGLVDDVFGENGRKPAV